MEHQTNFLVTVLNLLLEIDTWGIHIIMTLGNGVAIDSNNGKVKIGD